MTAQFPDTVEYRGLEHALAGARGKGPPQRHPS